MKKSLAAVRLTIVVALFITLVTTNAQAAADLTIYRASIVGPTTVVSYADFQVQFGLTNEGDERSSQFTIILYLSEDEDFTEDDYELADWNYGGIDPGGIRTGYDNTVIATDVSNGDYYLGLVLELSDGTHVMTITAGTITVARPTELWIAGVYADTAVRPGEQLDVGVSVYNDGMGVSDSFTIDCYINDHLIGSDYFGPLDGDKNGNYQVACEIPGDISGDYYYIRAVVSCPYDEDSGNDERDSDYIWIGAPIDLAIRSIQVTPLSCAPGERFVIHSLIENIGGRDSERYTVDYYISTDATITTDDYHIGYVERDDLSPGEQHSYETIYQIPFNLTVGNYYIGIIVTCPEEYDPSNNTGCSEATIELVHPAGYVCGQMLYQNVWYRREHPIRYALVEVYDADDNEDPLDDRVIGKTYTDPNGNYGVVVLNDETSSQNIYVKVFTESAGGAYPETTGKACSVRDDVFDEIYYLKSDLYPHPQDLSVVINMTALDDGGEFMVYDSVIEGFHKAKTFFDVNLPEITTFWPSLYEMSYFDPCDRGIYISQDDRGDRDVILHEYGHFIADVFAFGQGSVGDNPSHYWNADLRYNPEDRSNEEARNLTFRESWATLFSVATQYGDKWYTYSGDTQYNDWDEGSGVSIVFDLEEDTDNRCEPGEYYEHMTCCALWDIFDDNDDDVDDDDTLSDITLSKIWTIARESQPDDIIDFWNSWFQSYDYTSEITRIFQDHGMSFNKPEN